MTFTARIDEIVAENFNGLLSKPAHWPRVKLGDLATIKNGIPLPSSAFNKSRGVPVVRIRNVVGGTTETFFDGPVEEDWFIEHGDLLVGMDGDFNTERWKGPRALLNQRVCAVLPSDERVSLRYLSLVLPGYLAAINKHTPSITVKHLSSRTVADLPIPVPPPSEQEQLVDAIETHFSRLDAAVASLKRAKANVERARASVLQAAVEGRLVPTEAALARAEGRDYEPASALLARILAERKAAWEASGARGKYKEPVASATDGEKNQVEGWYWASVEQLTEAGFTNGLYVPKSAYGAGTPILRIDDFQNDWSRSASELRCVSIDSQTALRYGLQPGQLVVNRVNSMSHLGKCIAIEDRHVPAVFESNMMRATISREVSTPYLVFWLRSRVGKRFLLRDAKWAVNQASINQNDVGGTPVPLPPLAEQHRIVAEVDRRLSVLDALDATLDANLARCARLRQSILQRAFTGRLVPLAPSEATLSRTFGALPDMAPPDRD